MCISVHRPISKKFDEARCLVQVKLKYESGRKEICRHHVQASPTPTKPGSGSNILSHNSGCQPILHPSKPCKKFLRRLVILFYPLRWKTIVKRFSKITTSKFSSGSSKPETRNIDKKERKLQTEDSLWLCFVRYVLSVFYLHYDYIQFDMFYSCLGFSSVLLDMFCGCSFCVSKNRRFGPARLP